MTNEYKDAFDIISDARGILARRYDEVMPRVLTGEFESMPDLQSSAIIVWHLMGYLDMPLIIEMCLPEWHDEYFDLRLLKGKD